MRQARQVTRFGAISHPTYFLQSSFYPEGGMFFWVELPAGTDAAALLPEAVALGMAYVPGAAFYASEPRANTLRLSFVTVAAPQIERGVALLAQALRGGR